MVQALSQVTYHFVTKITLVVLSLIIMAEVGISEIKSHSIILGVG